MESEQRGPPPHEGPGLAWFIRLLGWDGLLPLFVLYAPSLTVFLVGNNRKVGSLADVLDALVAVSAFAIRYWIGTNHIAANNRAGGVRTVKYWIFFCGIVSILLLDAIMIAVTDHGRNNPLDTLRGRSGDLCCLALWLLIYLTAMAIAMYPTAPTSQNHVNRT